MIRLARRASLLVAFSLLTFTASASAACAWVLWEGSGKDPSLPLGRADRWQPKHAAPTWELCEMLRDGAEKTTESVIDIVLQRIPPDKKDLPIREVLDPD